MCSVLTDSAWIPVRNDVHLSGKLPFILWAEETYTNLTYFTYLHTTKLRPLISCSKNLKHKLKYFLGSTSKWYISQSGDVLPSDRTI